MVVLGIHDSARWRDSQERKLANNLNHIDRCPTAIQELRNVIIDYAKSVDSLDLSLARKVWSTGQR